MMITKNREQDIAIKEALFLANSVEAHGRRWAVRILGLPVPKGKFETFMQSKTMAVNFFKEYLNIHDVRTADIDCCHRIGRKGDGNQQLLIRFYSREICDYLLSSKKLLKGTGKMLVEDATQLNKNLMHTLKEHDDVESSWTLAGNIWMKLLNGKKMKVTIKDDYEEMIRDSLEQTPPPPKDGNTALNTDDLTTQDPNQEEPRIPVPTVTE
jgi:hypothetical protein